MTTLAANSPRTLGVSGTIHNSLPVVASDIIYEGAAVGISAGYARPLSAGDSFKGFAVEKIDNSAGAAGDRNIRIAAKGEVVLNVTSVTGVTDVGATVYASDDDTFTLASTGNSAIGKIIRHESGTRCVVAFESADYRSI